MEPRDETKSPSWSGFTTFITCGDSIIANVPRAYHLSFSQIIRISAGALIAYAAWDMIPAELDVIRVTLASYLLFFALLIDKKTLPHVFTLWLIASLGFVLFFILSVVIDIARSLPPGMNTHEFYGAAGACLSIYFAIMFRIAHQARSQSAIATSNGTKIHNALHSMNRLLFTMAISLLLLLIIRLTVDTSVAF